MDDKFKEHQVPFSDKNIINKDDNSQQKILEVNQNKEYSKSINPIKKPLSLLFPACILIFLFTPPGRHILNNISSHQSKSETKSNSIVTTPEKILPVLTQQIESVVSYLV